MVENEAQLVHDLACSTARTYLNNAREIGLDASAALIGLETIVSVVIMTLSVLQENRDHKRYFTEILDLMAERCIERIGALDMGVFEGE